ncbi:Organic cation/carnitine transporter 3 [Capsicum annuum]|uniref:Organic cation/carnitine transporter 3 n=1 Tax=Capsicum annuum TaxID=4072 RepID=A0A2G2ZKF6_CAPAN|nr:organic cation/carnitine transporter 3 [Capsicum annuum]KAF3615167.1 Organic cation/carnitine transporter 3 [Capsicum annuum]PHT82414.1 Organic cation/carnitine transporter 3 [Capsicum annuum]
MSDQSSEPLLLNRKKASKSLDETIERCIGEFGWAQLLQSILVSLSWVFDAQQTFISVFTDTLAVSEWSLQPGVSSALTGLPASSFFIGCLIGGLVLSTLADTKLGRKNMLILSCLIMSLTGTITSISTNIWMYSFFRLLSGFGRATIGTCALVLSTELVGNQWRGQVGIIGFVCFTIGFLSLPMIAYVNKESSWRVLYLWTCVPTILYSILVHLFVHESPRWLYVRGNKEEFVLTLKSITTRSSLTLSFFGSFFEFEDQEHNNSEESTMSLYSAIKMLIEKNWAFRRLISVMLVGFGIGMVYYGMPLGVGNLPFNLYLSVTLNALSELPASMVTFFLIGKLTRKKSLLGFAMLSGICSIGCVIVKSDYLKELQMGLELFSFFSACTCFNVLLIYTVELFPTCVRNSAVSMVRQALVLGGSFSPMLVAFGRENRWLSYGVFGICIAICGLFVLCLPETKGRTLSDTMDEEEYKESVLVC